MNYTAEYYVDRRTGMRYDLNPRTGMYFNPRAGMIYNPRTGHFINARTGLRVAVSKGSVFAERPVSRMARARGFFSSMFSTNYNPPAQRQSMRRPVQRPKIFTRRRTMMMAGNVLFRRR